MSFLGRLFTKGGQRTIGVDFGSSELKAAQFAPSPHGPVLEHVYKVQTPANSIKDGVVTDPPLVGEALRQLMSERELRESTKYEAERFLPYSVDEAQIDAKILGKAEDGQNMDVLVVAAQKDLVLSQASAIQYAGLSAGVVEVEPFAMVRAMIAPDDPRYQQNIAIINVGASTTSINITKAGFVPFTRNVPIGGAAFTKAIATGLNTPPDKAETIKREKAATLSQRDSAPVPPT